MRLLVTGSSGFLGRQVAQYLAAQSGFQVRGFDLRLPDHAEVPTIQGDLCDCVALESASRGVDAIIHLGGVGDIDVASAHPSLTTRSNVEGTINVALAATKAGARVIYASTWEVYGDPLYQPVDEDHRCAPVNFYGATKLSGEHMLNAAVASESLQVITLRLGTAYGPGMRTNTVFQRFMAQGAASRPLLVHGRGDQWRQFTHTSDIARAFLAACKAGDGHLLANITSDERVTIRQLADAVAEHYGVPMTFAPARDGDPPPAQISSERALRDLGWSAGVVFSQGLEELLASEADRVAGVQ